MVSQYTSPIASDPNFSFHDFIWRCARAFDPLSHMREEPPGTPISLMPFDTSVEDKTLQEDEERLALLKSLTPEQAEEHAQQEYEKALVRWQGRKREDGATLERMRAFYGLTNAWKPPTPDHEGLRRFMLSQLDNSILGLESTVPPEPVRHSGAKWLEAAIRQTEHSLVSTVQRRAKKEQMVQTVRAWVIALHESAPIPGGAHWEREG